MAIDFFDNEMDKMLTKFQETYQGNFADKQEFAAGLFVQLVGLGLAKKSLRTDRSRANLQQFMRRKELFHKTLNEAQQQFNERRKHARSNGKHDDARSTGL